MNKKKILLITSEFPPQPGGIGNHAFNLALALQKGGKDVIVLSDIRSKEGILEKEFDTQLPYQVTRTQRRKLVLLCYIDRIRKAMNLIRSNDTIIASGKFSLWMVLFLKPFYKRKWIAVIHGTELLLPNPILKKLTNKSLQSFDTVIAVSNYTKSLVKKLSLKNIVVIPNGFTTNNINIDVLNHQKPKNLQLITVGNVTQRKGQHNVIKAIPLLLKQFPNLIYHIVGIPTDKKQLENLATNLEVIEQIKFHGKVSEDKKAALLRSSSIFIMLSEMTPEGDVEGFGIAVLEANAYGIPAIGSKNSGIEDAINNGKSGILVDAKDPEMVVNAINNIMKSYDIFSDNASKWSSNFIWDKIVKQYIEVLDK